MKKDVHSGLLLLQALVPTRLIGSVMATVTAAGDSLVQVGFFSEAGTLEFKDEGSRATLLMSRSVAFTLISLFRVAVSQCHLLGGQIGKGATTVSAEASRHTVAISWLWGEDGASGWDETNGQVTLRLRGSLVAGVEEALVTELARLGTAADAIHPVDS